MAYTPSSALGNIGGISQAIGNLAGALRPEDQSPLLAQQQQNAALIATQQQAMADLLNMSPELSREALLSARQQVFNPPRMEYTPPAEPKPLDAQRAKEAANRAEWDNLSPMKDV